ncbi:hypothetical protein BC830DRAFT_1093392 [Chytriomyces sp. MP71]|nr:hypothetical protein BC830DRAFT_1093392 [Chytriomyces sp. MP71]
MSSRMNCLDINTENKEGCNAYILNWNLQVHVSTCECARFKCPFCKAKLISNKTIAQHLFKHCTVTKLKYKVGHMKIPG